jgi:hypothetical protein
MNSFAGTRADFTGDMVHEEDRCPWIYGHHRWHHMPRDGGW